MYFMDDAAREAAFDRIRSLFGKKSDAVVARALGVNSSAIPTWRKRATFPGNHLVAFAKSRNISLDWLILGLGDPPASLDTARPAVISEGERAQRAHADLLRASQVIGGIIECSTWYTQGLAERLARDGRDVNAMSVCELIQACSDYHHESISEAAP